MRFVSAVHLPEKRQNRHIWFVFQGDRLLVQIAGADPPRLYLDSGVSNEWPLSNVEFLGFLDRVPCFGAEVHGAFPLPADIEAMGLRRLLGAVDDEVLAVAGRARQLLQWSRNHRFCGRCGGRTRAKTDERARFCPDCERTWYPRVSPAVIVAVVRSGRILLARSARRPTGFYSVLAGFVEPGETLEEAVRREVHEEVGLGIKNLNYFGSQPWPFPDSLMVAFTAEYDCGEITVQPSEIQHAGWFLPDALPAVPGPYSIARRLIDWFVQAHDPGWADARTRNRPTP